jgi:hypothetical protein
MIHPEKYKGPNPPTDRLEPGLEKRLATYAAAAGAAGLGFLTSASVAEARIVFFPAHQQISSNAVFALDVNHDGVTDFNLTNTYGCNFDYCYGRLYAIPVAGNGVEGKLGFLGTHLASALNQGARIGPAQPFSGQLMIRTSMGSTGQWRNATNRYLGLKFRISGQVHFGWARLSVQIKSARVTALLTGYAYETVPDTAIIAGKTAGGAEGTATNPDSAIGGDSGPSARETGPVVDSGSLGILALGEQGLSLWRRKEHAAM